MAILWCGGEDLDFPNGNALTTDTTAGRFRSGWARCDISSSSSSTPSYSNAFPGGGVTTCWLTVEIAHNCFFTSGTADALMIGLIQKSTGNKGLWIGTGSDFKSCAIYTYDGTTKTRLAQSASTVWTGNTVVLNRIDMQIVYASSGSVNVWVNGALSFSYTGNTLVSGATALDAVIISGQVGNSVGYSEIIVSSTDCRQLGLVTMALTGAGDTNSWTNPTFSNVNGTAFSDATPTSSNTAAQDNMYNATDLPSGTRGIVLVKETIRAAVSSSPTATQIKMGYKSGGTVAFGSGASKTPANVYGSFEQFDATNPVTGTTWALSDMNALQLDFQSA